MIYSDILEFSSPSLEVANPPAYKLISEIPKDQLISRGLVGILNSSKKQTKKFDAVHMIPQVTYFCSFFGRIEDTKKFF